jgi:uncharacterized membrane protein YhaH (DUF805 family)
MAQREYFRSNADANTTEKDGRTMPIIENWKQVVFERYTKFDGRADRGEFWWFVLANFILYVVLAILMNVSSIFVLVYFAVAIGLIVPSLAVAIRRLHDTNKSGWFLLLGLIPLIGAIILIVFYATAGDSGDNNYGAPPLPGAGATPQPAV